MSTLETSADIVVIGAGIHGASVAYNLSQRLHDAHIVVLDRADAGGGATSASAAMLMHQTDDEDITRLAHLSINRYRALAKSLQVDIGLRQTGSILFSTTETTSKRLVELADYQQSLGIETIVVDGGEAETLSSGLLSGTGIVTATYCESDGYVIAPAVVEGYLKYATCHGTTLRSYTAACGMVVEDGNIAGVRLDSGELIKTGCVVNCAGSRAPEVGLWAGIELPIKRSHRNMLLLETSKPHHHLIPIIEDVDTGWYFRQHPKGVLMGVGPTNWLDDDRASFDATYDPSYEGAAIDYLRERAPSLLPFTKLHAWAGSRPMLDPVVVRLREGVDGHPIVGGVSDVGGFYLSCAWGAFGVTLAPIGGELAAQAICGEKPTVDVAPFSWARFTARDTARAGAQA